MKSVISLPRNRMAPDSITGNVSYTGTKLRSLSGSPTEVSGSFFVSINRLASLAGGPIIVGGSYCADNNDIVSLEGIPTKIGSSLDLTNNPMTSLQGINKLKEMNSYICLAGCQISSHILGVFFIKGCKGISIHGYGKFRPAVDIVNSHISKGRAGLLPCTQELIEAGLADFAQI